MGQFKDALEGMTIAKENGLATIYGANIDTIRLALRIADKVMQEPSGRCLSEGINTYEEGMSGDRLPDADGYDQVLMNAIFRAMIEQMMKEIEND